MADPLLTDNIRNRVSRVATQAAVQLMQEIDMFGPLTHEDLDNYERLVEHFRDTGWYTDPTAWNAAKVGNQIEQALQRITVVRVLLLLAEPALKLAQEKES